MVLTFRRNYWKARFKNIFWCFFPKRNQDLVDQIDRTLSLSPPNLFTIGTEYDADEEDDVEFLYPSRTLVFRHTT